MSCTYFNLPATKHIQSFLLKIPQNVCKHDWHVGCQETIFNMYLNKYKKLNHIISAYINLKKNTEKTYWYNF